MAVRSRRGERLVQRADRRRQDPGADQRLPEEVRLVGSLRLERRRGLHRSAGPLHRPLPDDPCRCGRGDRRRRTGHRRDLVAPLVRLLQQHRPRRSARREARRHPDRELRLLDRRLHDRAGERRRRRVLARVRPRPRSSGRVRHVGQHRRRRELDRLLDDVVERLLRQQRRPRRGHRRPAVPDELLGQVPARVAQLRGRLPGRQEEGDQARTGGGEHEAGPGSDRRAARQVGDPQRRDAVRGLEVLLLGRRATTSRPRWRGR